VLENKTVAKEDAPRMGRRRSEALLQIATPRLYLDNPFRLTGLSVEASRQRVSRELERLDLLAKHGATDSAGSRRALRVEPQPDAKVLRAALRKLDEPESRVLAELFWLWPLEPGKAEADEALRAVAGGDLERAVASWGGRAQGNDSQAVAAKHNLAVVQHARALDLEAKAEKAALSPAEQQQATELWASAVAYWKTVAKAEELWARIEARVAQLDDPRVTRRSVQEMRHTLGTGLALVSATLAIRDAEAGSRSVERQRRVLDGWMRDAADGPGLERAAVNEAIRRAIAPIQVRVSSLCASAKKAAEADPVHADRTARDLLAAAQPFIAVAQAGLPEDAPQRMALCDDVVGAVLSCQVDFANKTEDWRTSGEILREADRISVPGDMQTRLRENIRIVEKNASTGAQWCAPGYFALPANLVAVLEKARLQVAMEKFDEGIPPLVALLNGQPVGGDGVAGAPALVVAPDERRVVQTALAFAFNRKSLTILKNSLGQNDEPWLRRTLAARARDSLIDPMTAFVAMSGMPPPAGMALRCMACGERLQGGYFRVQLGEIKALICPACSRRDDQDKASRATRLSSALQAASEGAVLACDLEPGDETYRGNLDNLRNMAAQGKISLPTPAEARRRCGLGKGRLMRQPRPGAELDLRPARRWGAGVWFLILLALVAAGILIAKYFSQSDPPARRDVMAIWTPTATPGWRPGVTAPGFEPSALGPRREAGPSAPSRKRTSQRP